MEVERKSGRTGWPPDVWATELKKNFNNGTNENSSNTQVNKTHRNYENTNVKSSMQGSNDLMRTINANNYYLTNNGNT